jgi:hypothetical protein
LPKRTGKLKKLKPSIPPAIAEKLARNPRAIQRDTPPQQRGAGHTSAPMRHQGR